jgi:NAD(P)-dependent dehydrogenase (short-subunit alcohol dehydrogenase family)
MQSFEGKVAVVTGAASGIGLAMAQRFGAEGMRLVLADIEGDALASVVDDLQAGGVEAVGQVTDVSKGDDVDALGQAALDAFGTVHLVCNNAGVGGGGQIDTLTTAEWEWVLGVNLWGVIHGIHAFLPRILEQERSAHIVNTSSLAGLASGLPQLGPYNVSKVGVVALSETLRMELAMSGAPIGVSVLCPGSTGTRILESERNRPAHLGREVRREEGDAFREAVRSGFDGPAARSAEQVAKTVLDAVRASRFWVITSGEMQGLVASSYDEMSDATPAL